ncbi:MULTISPECIES: LLM class oxidoreductase [unclassified Pseudomonas]|uniref:LLM class oxidoreductase n=1 Tax=unclassified Pseudomonas TaxID=196821 RepID=UPI0002700DF0|nr:MULTISPECIES: LLM class oxidoreductase [unclassified Pseudomonas]EJM06411.1 luciferase-type oxidoreductase, BA3436 family [Pseudomonas sp. GM16]EJM44316.1 luciferase-type oxidoreductase, BA3436 family [Pseudomonas sp. GM24]
MSSRYTSAPELQQHRGYARVFQPGHLTFGFIAPLESYPDSPGPTLQDHAQLARRVDEAGFSAIWLRDVPFYDPNFGDVGQILDPLVYAGFLAGVTRNIAIGTAGIVLPLRDPLIVAKQAASIDQLLGGRFILGLATGDRPVEYPAFGFDFNNRAERFRDALAIIRAATETHWPVHASKFYGQLNGDIDLIPKPVGSRLPTIIVGQAGQSLEWIGENTDGILSYISNPILIPQIIERWRTVYGQGIYKPYGYGTLFDLDRDPNFPLQAGRVLRAGRNALIEHWKRQQDQGVGHVALHFKPQRRHASEVIDELGEYLLPHFPSASLPVEPSPMQARS